MKSPFNSDWQETTVGTFCPFLYGKGLPETVRKPGNIPVVSSAGIIGSHDESLVKTGGIVIGRKGTVGSLTLLDRPFWPIDTSFYVPDGPKQRDLRFTFYLLKTLGLHKMNSDSAVPGLNRDNAHQRIICVPELKEQKSIAAVLGALDDKIELNRRMNATLEAMARALFKSWFVDFDPVRAKMEGKQPFGMDAATAALFPSRFVSSALGDIPEGWNVGVIRDLCERVESGGTPSRKESTYWDTGLIPWLTSGEVRQKIVLDTNQKITQYGLDNSNAKLWPRLTTVVAMYGATAGQVTLLGNTMSANQACCALIPRNNTVSFVFLKTSQSVSEYEGQATGSAQQNLNQTIVANLLSIVPQSKILEAFEAMTSPYIRSMIQSTNEIKYIERKRDYLLPKLVSGDIRIADVEKFLKVT